MDIECEKLIEKINLISRDAQSKLQGELYPKNLGDAVMMQAPEMRLAVLSKYEGIGSILKDLGTDISRLETMIEEEGEKTLTGRY